MYKGKTFREFNRTFKNEDACRQYLFDIKWENGFLCKRCGHKHCWKGRTRFHARCVNCDYDESLTANTIFHKIQIPLLKALPMANHIVMCKNGVSTVELAKHYGVDEKTAARFRLKCQDAMDAWFLDEIGEQENEKHTAMDGINLMHRGEKLNGLQRVDVLLQKFRSNDKSLTLFIGKSSVSEPDVKTSCELISGSYVGEVKDIRVWNCRKWLEGTHHHCSAKYIRKYEHEFYFRFNNRHREEQIFHILIGSIMKHRPPNLRCRAA